MRQTPGRRSSAAASAAWPSRSGCRPPASRRRSSSAGPAGRARLRLPGPGLHVRRRPHRDHGPGCLEELFDGRRAARIAGPRRDDAGARPFYRLFWEDGYRFDYSNDLESTRSSRSAAKSPSDVDGYERFLAYAEEVFEQGYTRLAHVPFLDWWSMVRVAPQLVRLQAYRSVYSAVSRFIRDPHLRQTFSFHSLLVGGNPFTASAIYTLIHFLERKWGVLLPARRHGGAGARPGRALPRARRRAAARLRRRRDPDARRPGVRVCVAKDGWRARFDIVASNADVVHTYGELLARASPSDAARRARLRRMRHSMSLFLIYFGTRRRHPQLAHHNVIFGPRYRELLADIFDRGSSGR